MNADSNKLRATLAEQLSSFETRLDGRFDDIGMLADIQEGIGQMLGGDGANEAEVRRVLQERYESGDLRKETFPLVKSMLDRFVSEKVPTADDARQATQSASQVQTIADAARELVSVDDETSETMVMPALDSGQSATADDRVQAGSVLRDRFMLQERVTGGSMGVVYKALDRRLAEADAAQPTVAIKVLSPFLAENGQALRALQQEAAKGRCLAHPNIVRFIDLDRDEDLYFIVMEWLDGRTLADILDAPETAKLPTDRAFAIVNQIGRALVYAHSCGIVHADVKPGNIMIMPNGDAKLFDFGVARVRQKQIEDRQEFDPGVLGLLTPAYSSMQVLTGDDPTPSDDVFSLACLLYRLLVGYRVFGPRNAAEAAEEGMKPQCPQGLSEDHWRVLKKALSYSRVARYEAMQDFIDELNADGSEPITLTVPERDEPDIEEDSPVTGRRAIALVALLVVLAVAGYRFGYLDDLESIDDLKDRFLPAVTENQQPPPDVTVDAELIEPIELGLPLVPVNLVELFKPEASAAPIVVDEITVETAAKTASETTADIPVATNESAVESIPAAIVLNDAPPLIDFSLLPPPTAELQLRMNGSAIASTTITLREDRAPTIIDLVRDQNALPLKLRLEEVGFTGNRSPLREGQYEIGGGELIEFPAGQKRARFTLSMTSDRVREADRQSTLRVREVDSVGSQLATITVNLEDDDQRRFEARLPPNTVAFATSQVSVRERDPAVQIDVIRYNPDFSRLTVDYTLRDITATQGEDYFAPGSLTIEFGPGQRNARLLIPLVQDFAFEDNEVFMVELTVVGETAPPDIFLRTAVVIRDDDS